MLITVPDNADPSAFQIPGSMEQGPSFEPSSQYTEFGYTTQETAPQAEEQFDLEDDSITNSPLFEAEAARESALNVAISSKEVVPNPPINAAEILKFTTNAGRELVTWRHWEVSEQNPDFIDSLRTKVKNRWS